MVQNPFVSEKVQGGWVVGGTFDFRVTPNPNFMLDVNLDEEFDNNSTCSRK